MLARDQHDPDGPLVRRRITRTYRRTAYHLQVLSVRDADRREQTIRVRDEHPLRNEDGPDGHAGRGWTKARELSGGDVLLGAAGEASTVIGNLGEEHAEGVTVYNLEVEDAHSYFVRGEGADGEPVWVHNAGYIESRGNRGSDGASPSGRRRMRLPSPHADGISRSSERTHRRLRVFVNATFRSDLP